MMTTIPTLAGKIIQDVSVAKINDKITSISFLFSDGEKLQIEPLNHRETLILWPNDKSSATAADSDGRTKSERPNNLSVETESGAAVRWSAWLGRTVLSQLTFENIILSLFFLGMCLVALKLIIG